MGCTKKRSDTGGQRRRSAGAHGLNVRDMAEVKAAEAVAGVRRRTVESIGVARTASTPDPTAGVIALGVTAAGSGEGVERAAVVAVIGERDGSRNTGGSGGSILGAGGIGGGDNGQDPFGLGGKCDVRRTGKVEVIVACRGD